MLSLTTIDNGYLTLAMILGGVTILLLTLRRARKRSAAKPRSVETRAAQIRDRREMRHSLDDLLVELEELSRRINAQVDTKFAKLEQVIRDADDRLARLESAMSDQAGTATQVGPGDTTHALPQAPDPPEPRSTVDAVVGAPDEAVSEAHRQVYDLADAGKTADQIAEVLQVPLGEVELVLNLRTFR